MIPQNFVKIPTRKRLTVRKYTVIASTVPSSMKMRYCPFPT